MMTNKVSTEIAGMEPGQVFFPHAKVVFIIQVSDVLMCFCEWASQLREWASQLREWASQLCEKAYPRPLPREGRLERTCTPLPRGGAGGGLPARV